MRKQILVLLVGAALLAFSACKQNKKGKEQHEKSSKKHVEWTYKGEQGAENWGNLCTDFADCNGKQQSPININTADLITLENAPELNFAYGTIPADIVNNGHTIQFNVAEGNTLQIGEQAYQLLQFHYHALSEHTVDGLHYPLEVHFVHKGENGLAVVGVFFEEGAENNLLKDFMMNFPKKKGKYSSDKQIVLASLLPSGVKYYHYDGSLTTPPCSEIVDWYVLQKPITASKEQLVEMQKILHNNYRPVQELNGRKVVVN